MTIEYEINRSAAAFRDIVWPQIGPHIGGGELIPVESVTDSGFTRLLDRQAGIDAWIVRLQFLPSEHMHPASVTDARSHWRKAVAEFHAQQRRDRWKRPAPPITGIRKEPDQ